MHSFLRKHLAPGGAVRLRERQRNRIARASTPMLGGYDMTGIFVGAKTKPEPPKFEYWILVSRRG